MKNDINGVARALAAGVNGSRQVISDLLEIAASSQLAKQAIAGFPKPVQNAFAEKSKDLERSVQATANAGRDNDAILTGRVKNEQDTKGVSPNPRMTRGGQDQ